MRILCINHEYPSIGVGTATVTKELLERLYVKGHEIVLLTGKIQTVLYLATHMSNSHCLWFPAIK